MRLEYPVEQGKIILEIQERSRKRLKNIMDEVTSNGSGAVNTDEVTPETTVEEKEVVSEGEREEKAAADEEDEEDGESLQ